MKGISKFINPDSHMLNTSLHQYTIISNEADHFPKSEYQLIYKARIEDLTKPLDSFVQIRKITKSNGTDALFKKELKNYKTATELHQPQLQSLIDWHEDTNYYYFVTPYCNKGTLTSYISKGEQIDEQNAIDFIRQLAIGLKALHSKLVILNGLRTDDVFVSEINGKISLSIGDYGFSRAMDQSISLLPKIGVLIVKAPEASLGTYTFESDIYAFGCILYKLLVGKELLIGSSENEILEFQKSMNMVYVNAKFPLSAKTLELLEGCTQFDYKCRMTISEISHLLDLDHYSSENTSLNLGNQTLSNVISCQGRSTVNNCINYDLIKVINYEHIPAPSKHTITDAKDITDLRIEIDTFRNAINDIKIQQQQLEKSNSEKGTNITKQNALIDDLKLEILYIKKELECSKPKPTNSYDDVVSSINSLRKSTTNDVCKLQSEYSKLLETNNKAFELYNKQSKLLQDTIEKQRSDTLELKQSISSIESAPHLDSKLQIQISKLNEEISKSNEVYMNDISQINEEMDKNTMQITEIKKTIAKYDKNNKIEANNTLPSALTDDTKKSIEALQNQISLLHERINTHDKAIEGVEHQKDEIYQANALLKSLQIDSIHTDICRLQSQINQLSENQAHILSFRDIKDGKDKASIIEEYRKLLTLPIEHVRGDIDQLKVQLNALAGRCLNPSISDPSKKINDCKNNIGNYMPIVEDSNSISQLHEQLNSNNELLNEAATKCNIEFKRIYETTDMLKLDICEIKKSLAAVNTKAIAAEMNKLQEQINQIKESNSQQKLINSKNAKTTHETLEKQRFEINELKNTMSLPKLSHSDNTMMPLQTKMQEELNCKIAQVGGECKQLFTLIELYNVENAELKKLLNSVSYESTQAELGKLQLQYKQLNDLVNQNIHSQNRDSKTFLELSEKLREEIGDARKTVLSVYAESMTGEIAKFQNHYHQIKENVDNQIATVVNAIENIKSELNLNKANYPTKIPSPRTVSSDISKLYAYIDKVEENIKNKIQGQDKKGNGDEISKLNTHIALLQENCKGILNELEHTKADITNIKRSRQPSPSTNAVQQLAELVNNINTKQTDIEHNSAESFKTIMGEINNINKTIANLEINISPEQISKLEQEINEFHHSIEAKVIQIVANDQDKLQLAKSIQSITIEITLLNEQHAKMQNDANCINKRIKQLEIQFEKVSKYFTDIEASRFLNKSLDFAITDQKSSLLVKKEARKLSFKTPENVVMRIELIGSKFRISNSKGIVKEEISITNITTLKLDDANRCVYLHRKTITSPTKNMHTPRSICMKLCFDTLAEAIELYKFIRNAQLKSEKRCFISSTSSL